MERDRCEFICGAPTTFQGYGIEYNKIEIDYFFVCIFFFFFFFFFFFIVFFSSSFICDIFSST